MSLPVFPFRLKISILLSGVLLLLGSIAVTRARNDIRYILATELESRGEAIAKNLAANSVDSMLTGDLYTLYELVNRTKTSDADIRYIFIVNPTGILLISTFEQDTSPPHGLLEANTPAPEQTRQIRRLKTEEGLIRDIGIPILQGEVGTVRIGMSDQAIETAVSRNTRSLSIMALLSAILGFAVSYWLAFYLTRPLSHLVNAVQSVARGNLSQRISSPGGDEVGQLGQAFNTMTMALVQKETARQALRKKVITSQEEERKRIARELHDELAQRLTSVVLSLETIESRLDESDKANKQAIYKAKKIAQDSLTETRKLIGDLRPSVLDDLGLIPAIRSYGETHLHPIQCDIVISASGLPKILPPILETAVFRIVQESINNIVKHARAKSVKITLSVENGVFHGIVNDDGLGFKATQLLSDTPSAESGLGLQGMQERADLMGGELSIQSVEGQGTNISFSIPLSTGDDYGG